MGKKVAGYFMVAVMLQLLSASLLSAQNDCPSCSAFGVQRLSDKKAAPLFSLKMADGKQANLADFKGKPVAFTFWASWCESCKEEIPLIEKFSQGKRDQITLLLVAIDGENEKRIQRIIKDKKISLPVLLDVKEKIASNIDIIGPECAVPLNASYNNMKILTELVKKHRLIH